MARGRPQLPVAVLVALVVAVLALSGAWVSPARAGEVAGFGGAPAEGGSPPASGADRVVALVGTPTGAGYWQVTAAGAVHPHGDARSFGPASTLHRADVVGMAPTTSGGGYWLVTARGGIFTFGDAPFRGSTGGMRLARPIVGMTATPSGRGYWLVASDGGVFTFGDAPFLGSAGGERLGDPVVGMAATATGAGYRLATADGRVLRYGDATEVGSLAAACKTGPVVAIAARRGGGFWLGGSGFPGAAIPPRAHPVDVVAAESANLAMVLRIRQGCQPRPAPSADHLTSPLPGSRLTSGYGERVHPIYGRRQFHAGIDLAGGSGRILAAADGRVVQVANRQGYGLTTILDHGDGVGTVYSHQAAVGVRPGDAVRRGQPIGTVGRSGFATGEHLHWEVRVHGVPTDPRHWR